MNENPQLNQVLLVSADLGVTVACPTLNEDDTFNSNPMLGFITYRLPPIAQVLGIPSKMLDKYLDMEFTLQIKATDENSEDGVSTLICKTEAYCKITFRKFYTPVLQGLEPPVVYFGSKTRLWFDPKAVPTLITDLKDEQKLFVYAKVGGSLIDFEDTVSFETTFNYWMRNYATGIVGD